MFAAIFVICNMELGLCRSYTPEYTFSNIVTCIDISEETRVDALNQLPKSAIIMYECVEFPSPT